MLRYINSGIFFASLLLFFLPFINIKCNDAKLASVSGYSLMTAGDMDVEDLGMLDYIKNNEGFSELENSRKKKPDVFTWAAAIAILVGGIVSLTIKKNNELFVLIIAFITVIILILFRVLLLMAWKENIASQTEMLSYIRISLGFAAGYWLLLITHLLLGISNSILLFLKKKQERYQLENTMYTSPDMSEEV